MITKIHFHEKGEHRIMSANEFYIHSEIGTVLKENGIKPDDKRFMLVYVKTKGS